MSGTHCNKNAFRAWIRRARFTGGLLFGAALILGASVKGAEPNSGETLQVQVATENLRPRPAIVLTSAFVTQVRDSFHQLGYAGAVVEVTGHTLPDPGCVLLELNVAQWSEKNGRVDCTFAATLRTNQESLPLGRFRETGLRLNRKIGDIKPADNSASSKPRASALQPLYRAIADTHLVPGLHSS